MNRKDEFGGDSKEGMMIKIKKSCTGCMACRNICPVHAIHQKIDSCGFVMPEIDSSRCIACGKCTDVCPIVFSEKSGARRGRAQEQTERTRGNKPGKRPRAAFAMVHRSDAVVKKSSSGGVFYALSSLVLEQGGIVFGCYYDIRRKKAYLADTDHVTLEELLTSKYVESYIGFGFKRVKAQLETGRKVLFCGTPCQAAGLASFLNKPYDNLLLVDFTCGAVSAQKYLRDYLVRLERKYRSKITALSFRDKHYGWGQYCFLAYFECGKVYRKTAMADPYFFCFLRSSMQRLSCHGCSFSNRHFSDVVLSDYWKCGEVSLNRNKSRGISLVLAMTEKGMEALEAIRGMMDTEELEVGEASYNLQDRRCPKTKLPEIFAHQACASAYGVEVLRKTLLSPKQRLCFAVRQWVMDHPRIAKRFPHIAGNGQIMKST